MTSRVKAVLVVEEVEEAGAAVVVGEEDMEKVPL